MNGRKSVFIAAHVYQVEDLDKDAGEALIAELMASCTRPEFTYSHTWQVGDVLLWDQRAILHRDRPWPFGQPRTLASVCFSMRDTDGLTDARDAIR